ncbi:MAG: c-type cytochrome [Pseudomonadales bacterium]|nr:c-type cytochrome [Pseudomonadales bacterium]
MKRMHFIRRFLLSIITMVSIINHSAAEPVSTEKAADIYNRYCVLCHGNQGMGDGLLPIKIDNYSKANLLLDIKANSKNEIIKIIMLGGQVEGISSYMPPWQGELKPAEIEALAELIMGLRTDTQAYIVLLKNRANLSQKVDFSGRVIYQGRCVLCHGSTGEGNGRMARIIKTPPPADLTASRLPDEMMLDIIRNGGQVVGRSPQMPPWKDQLSEPEIKVLMGFLKSIRD